MKRVGVPLEPCICGWIYLDECTAWYCGGNRARLERWKLALGTRITYLPAAPRVGLEGQSFLVTNLMIESYRRGVRESYKTHAIDAGHSIDAPEYMPAGGCYNDSITVGKKTEYFPSQFMIRREPDAEASAAPIVT